jgi:F-type H+-transporting ATPase subunit b
MLTFIVTKSNGGVVDVRLSSAITADDAETTSTGQPVDTGPNPIAAEPKELLWSAGAFLVLLVVMRYFLFPRLKKGMDERYASIRSNIEGADHVKSSARADVANYDAAVAAVRVEAAARVDAARQTLDNERTARLSEVNARIATARAEADAANNAARAAGQAQVATAVATVVTQAAELASGSRPEQSVVDQVVKQVMESAGK